MGQEKRLLLAVVLMLAVVFGVNLLFPPRRPPEPLLAPDSVAARHAETSLSGGEPPGAEPMPDTTGAGLAAPVAEDTAAVPSFAAPAPSRAADTVWVDGPLYRLAFTTRGARLLSAEMLEFESLASATKGEPVQLIRAEEEDFFTHQWIVGNDTLDLRNATFEFSPKAGISLAAGGEAQTLTAVYNPPGSRFRAELRYSFEPDRYVVEFEGRLSGGPAGGWWALGLGSGLQSNEWDPEADYGANLAFIAKGLDGVKSQKIADVDPGGRLTLDGPFDWVAVRTKYFVSAVVLPQDASEQRRFAGLFIEGTPADYRARGVASFPVGRQGDFAYLIYLGPQDFGRLSAIGHDLDQVTPYGYKWLQPVLRPLAGAITSLLVWMHRFLGLGYGWILIIFGVGIRVVLFPLYQKSMRSQMATMRVQPLMKEIQEKHKGDPQKLQQEMMKLYKEHKINPLGGCLPMLLPFPILIALFFVFRDTIEFRGVPFLWLPDLSRADPLYVIPVLMGASIFLMQWISQRSMPQSNPQMKMMMWIMPIMLTVLFLNFASGLNLYYATMNIASLPQQLYLAKERKAAAVQPPVSQSSKSPKQKRRK